MKYIGVAVRLAALAVAVLAVHWALDALMKVTGGGARLLLGLVSMPLALIGPAALLARWDYSLPGITFALFVLVSVDTVVFAVVEFGWGWLSVVNVAFMTALRGTLSIGLFLLIIALLRARTAAKAHHRTNPGPTGVA